MLTKKDFDQLRGIIREEVEAENKEDRRQTSFSNLQVRTDLEQILSRLKTVEIDTSKTRELAVKIDQKLNTAQTDIAHMVTTLSEYHDVLQRRVSRIEKHSGLPKPQ